MSIGFEALLELAEGDYKMCLLAEKGFPDEYAARGAVYHLQQAIEKALKAAVLINGETPPFTHNIAVLAHQCNKLGMGFRRNLKQYMTQFRFGKVQADMTPIFPLLSQATGRQRFCTAK